MRFGDFFSGIGGTAVGARAAGLELVFGVEYDPDLAAVYRRNLGDHVLVEDVTTLDVAHLPAVDVFHASPSCINASVANANGGEAPQDLAMAQAVCRYIAMHRPQVVTLENVYGYRNFESWHEIARALLANGYTYAFWHVNMADYGVPQTRKRMIVIARRDGRTPMLPEATHAKDPQPGLFGTLRPWVGWYEAIEDILYTLPESQFAPWQMKRLPEGLSAALLWSHGRSYDQKGNEYGPVIRQIDQPSVVCTANSGLYNAWLCEASNASSGSDRWGDQPAQTVTTGGRTARAFIVDGKLSTSRDAKTLQITKEGPTGTVTASHSAFRDTRAYTHGRVVKMTPRALARFQSFPDWYELPDNARLATTGIGNAVPPLFAEKLFTAVGDGPAAGLE